MLIENTSYTFTVDRVWVLIVAALLVLLAGSAVGLWRAVRRSPKSSTGAAEAARWLDPVKGWLGIRNTGRAGTLILAAVIVAFALLFVMAVIASFLLIGTVIVGDQAASPQSLGLGALLVALLGAPFLIWRSVVAQKTLDLQDEALFNDKINAAAEDLAARRQVTRSAGAAQFNAYEDDVVTRSAAIDRLAGLARERAQADPNIVPRIASLLSVYVRELSKSDLKPKELGLSREEATPEALREWAHSLRPIRSDLEKAAQVLGRLRKVPGQDGLVVDLREANLQGFDLKGSDFDKAQMEGAQMQGANLSRAQMQGANLNWAQMQGANLNWAQMQRANLRGAQMQGADLRGAQMQRADLNWAQMQRANLRGAQMQRADLRGAQMQRANLGRAEMQGANLRGAQMQRADLRGAQMQRADLNWAEMQGANLNWAEIDQSTRATETTYHGAGVARVDWSSADLSIPQVTAMFGDASVTLPFENPEWWPDVALDAGLLDLGGPNTAWRIEFTHWRSNPDTYDWSQRRQHYTADGQINPDNPPPEYDPDDDIPF